MSNHMDLVRKSSNGAALRAAGEGIRVAVAVTDTELITGRAGFLGRFGSRVERFELSALSELKHVPNPSANLLVLEFAGSPARTLALMYERSAQTDFDQIVAVLSGRVRKQQRER
jgi:hypothetical protein